MTTKQKHEPTGTPIEDISDTARWVSIYRAMETERRDALFRDPYARLLAGERGEEIARKMKWGGASAWAMIVRTSVFDELILSTIEHNRVDSVLNLAAGLDTRPYRLPLSASLRWTDVDFPVLLSYKEQKLAGERPRCMLELVKMDLANAAARRGLFERIGKEAKRTLVVSEGLLVYLTEDQVAALAADLFAVSSLRWWLIDLTTPAMLEWFQQNWGRSLAAGNAQMKFAPKQGIEFFRPYGWHAVETRSASAEARRLKREMPLAWLWRLMAPFTSNKRQEQYRQMDSNFVLLERV